MDTFFANKVVVVTGASRGIGRDVALAFARRGARLAIAARSADGLAELERELRDIGVEVVAIPTDVTSDAAVEAMIETTMHQYGGIDVLVNNAGIAKVGGVESAAFDGDVRLTMQASLFGMIRVTQQALPILRQQGSGAIVNMSSVMGRKAFERFGSYAIVMHAVSAFSDALRQEVSGSGIRVSVIHPALTATDLLRNVDEAEMPLPFRYMTPMTSEDVALAVVAAVRHGTPRVVLPRVANVLLLGEAVSPRLGDLIARALSQRPFAWLFGLSSGTTYHQAVARRQTT